MGTHIVPHQADMPLFTTRKKRFASVLGSNINAATAIRKRC